MTDNERKDLIEDLDEKKFTNTAVKFVKRYFPEDFDEKEARNDFNKNVRTAAILKSYIEYLVLKQSVRLDEISDFFMKNGYFFGDIFDVSEITNNISIRRNFRKALASVEKGSYLSPRLHYSFDGDDLETLAFLHRDLKSLRTKIEDLLEDCNFHTECRWFKEGKYDIFIQHNIKK